VVDNEKIGATEVSKSDIFIGMKYRISIVYPFVGFERNAIPLSAKTDHLNPASQWWS